MQGDVIRKGAKHRHANGKEPAVYGSHQAKNAALYGGLRTLLNECGRCGLHCGERNAIKEHQAEIENEVPGNPHANGQRAKGGKPGEKGFPPVPKTAPEPHQQAAQRHPCKTEKLYGGQVPIRVAINAANQQLGQKSSGDAQEDKETVYEQQPAEKPVRKSIPHALLYIGKNGCFFRSLLLLWERDAANEADPQRSRQNIHEKGGAQGAYRKQRAGGRGGGKLNEGLHGGIDPVKAHELLLRHELGQHRVNCGSLNARPERAENRHGQQGGKQGWFRGDMRHRQHHGERDHRDCSIGAKDQRLAAETVCPNAAHEGNQELRQVRAGREGGHPCAGESLQRDIPDDGHLNQRGTEQRDTLAGEEEERTLSPAALLWDVRLLAHRPDLGFTARNSM